MLTPDFNVIKKPNSSKFENFSELKERRTFNVVDGRKYIHCVLKNDEVDLTTPQRALRGIGLFILTLGTIGLSLAFDRVRDSWKETLDGRSIKYTKTPTTDTTQRISLSSTPILISSRLRADSGVGKWMNERKSILNENQQQVAEGYWNKYIANKSRNNHSMLIDFMKTVPDCPPNFDKNFINSIEINDLRLFSDLFKHLSIEDLGIINQEEQLNIMPELIDKPIKVTPLFLRDLKDYIRDTHFSGVISISDGISIYTIASDNINKPERPIAIHSIGKVFTGVLLLKLIEEGKISEEVLNQPIKLSPDVINSLSPDVQKQLKTTTLLELMLHKGRLGDYLGNYLDAIDNSLKTNSAMPKIDHPKDFLKYADKGLSEHIGPDGFSYSNLGLLLVGLSIEELYNKDEKNKLTYPQILDRFVISPSQINTFETTRPKEARFNEKDPVAPHIVGGPAGGYWCTVKDLQKFGDWLGDDSKRASFLRLLQDYGGEFYSNREISHGGSIQSSSVHLLNRAESGLTLIVASDVGGSNASKFAQTIKDHLFR